MKVLTKNYEILIFRGAGYTVKRTQSLETIDCKGFKY